MKCSECGGTGEVEIIGDSVTDVCDKCGGTGFFCEMRVGDVCTLGSPCPHQKPLTNEEYIRSCSTEELAEFLITVAFEKRFKERIHWRGYANMHSYKTEVLEWLKEKHNA